MTSKQAPGVIDNEKGKKRLDSPDIHEVGMTIPGPSEWKGMERDIAQCGDEVQAEEGTLTLEGHGHMEVASTSNHYHQRTTQAVQTDIGHYPRDLEAELDRMRQCTVELEQELEAGSGEVETWARTTMMLCEHRREAFLREERAQRMLIGAEKRLREREEEYTMVLRESKRLMEYHANQVARLNSQIEAEREAQEEKAERSRLVGAIMELQFQLAEVYTCNMYAAAPLMIFLELTRRTPPRCYKFM